MVLRVYLPARHVSMCLFPKVRTFSNVFDNPFLQVPDAKGLDGPLRHLVVITSHRAPAESVEIRETTNANLLQRVNKRKYASLQLTTTAPPPPQIRFDSTFSKDSFQSQAYLHNISNHAPANKTFPAYESAEYDSIENRRETRSHVLLLPSPITEYFSTSRSQTIITVANTV